MPIGDTVLVLTDSDDPTADAVITALAAHPVRVARIDTGDFPAGMRLSAINLRKGWTGRLCTDHVTGELEQVRAGYYRRPTRFTFPAGMSQADCVDAAVDFAQAVTNPVVCKTLSSLVLGGHCQVDGAGVFGCLVSADAYDSGDHGA